MDIKKHILDHVAIAVADLDKAKAIYEDLGIVFEKEQEIVKEQDVEVAFGQIDVNARLELLAPLSDKGPIHKFIKKRGEGIHHLCIKVEDVEKKSKELVDKGYHLLYDTPKLGAHSARVNFIHPKKYRWCFN